MKKILTLVILMLLLSVTLASCVGPNNSNGNQSGENVGNNEGSENGENNENSGGIGFCAHYLNGSVASSLANADGSYNYDVAGIKLFQTNTYVCNGTAKGYYTCEQCYNIININVFKPHIAIESIATMPTCEKEGTLVTVCDDCNTLLNGEKTVAALGHDYKYELDTASFSLSYACQREGCDESVTKSVATYVVTSGTAATCKTPETICYKVTTTNGDVYENVAIYGKTLPHKLNGQDTFSDTEYDYGTAGIKYFADSVIECGKTIRAYFNCEVCQGIVEVQVNKPDHNYSLDYSTLVKPDYKTAGSVHYKCTNADCQLFMNIVLPAVVTTGAPR